MECEIETLLHIVKDAKRNSKIIVFSNGCFDILHCGHCKYLSEAKKLGDILIIGLNTDKSVKNLKGDSRPINNQQDRAYVLSSLKSVDYVIYFDEETPLNLINKILPDVLVKGSDYALENIVGADVVINNGGKVITIPLVDGKSTSALIENMNKS
jgi:D-beta-D-heptose 7-phosphate kinase/D-beta-D-heptose 1-phosphate adenosyltransferase